MIFTNGVFINHRHHDSLWHRVYANFFVIIIVVVINIVIVQVVMMMIIIQNANLILRPLNPALPPQRVISQSRTFEWFLIQACHPCSLIILSSLSIIIRQQDNWTTGHWDNGTTKQLLSGF